MSYENIVMDFKGKKITVMGLGVYGGGIGVARFLAKAGAHVLVTDLKKEQELRESIWALKGLPIQFVLGQHRNEDFSRADMVIKNPAVSENAKPLQIARENKVPIETDIGIFFELCPAPIIGITGTRGKSTTSALVYEILRSVYKNTVLAGNIRVSVLDELPKVKKEGMAVLELSSWQLEGLPAHKKSPHVAVMTNIMPDHLNRYKNMRAYIEAKKNIFRFQNKNDYSVLNYDDKVLREFAQETRSRVYFYGINIVPPLVRGGEERSDSGHKEIRLGAWLKNEKIVFGESTEEIMDKKDVKLLGAHNLYNVLAAITAAKIENISHESIRGVVSKFSGLADRLQRVKVVKGVAYINDTTSTIPEATIAALQSFSGQSIVLIAGGTDKGLEYGNLAECVSAYPFLKKVLLLPGTATDKLNRELKNRNYENIIYVENMEQAVLQASSITQEGDIVLLSPAAASFELFKNEFERGEKFKELVERLS